MKSSPGTEDEDGGDIKIKEPKAADLRAATRGSAPDNRFLRNGCSSRCAVHGPAAAAGLFPLAQLSPSMVFVPRMSSSSSTFPLVHKRFSRAAEVGEAGASGKGGGRGQFPHQSAGWEPEHPAGAQERRGAAPWCERSSSFPPTAEAGGPGAPPHTILEGGTPPVKKVGILTSLFLPVSSVLTFKLRGFCGKHLLKPAPSGSTQERLLPQIQPLFSSSLGQRLLGLRPRLCCLDPL